MKLHNILMIVWVTPIVVCPTFASTRSSADYAVTTETVDGGGERATSAQFVNIGSLGGVNGISAVAAPGAVAKQGYIGQLYDIAELELAAAPPTVNEEDPRQLTAAALLDDATWLSIAAGSVAWNVVSGPIASISPGGLALAEAVYQNTAASVGGAYQNASGNVNLLVLDIDPDNYGFYAGDGLYDGWQVQYFGLDNPNALPGEDPDGDGQTNGFERVAGTIPTDALSLFQLWIEDVPGQPTHKDLVFRPRWSSRAYTPLFRADADSGSFGKLESSATADVGQVRTVTDLNATNDHRFYRININLP